eukprot:TRINITY_DN3577_c0_g1_i1.p1 TRINITY_DN3577_c0_g1~~TRINITY_DN3577_c0_g1_i1.p1  ORF type:complete len:179 (+),score=45.90 TRINITY_DN3577_c0_g1_i1:173-709(+)
MSYYNYFDPFNDIRRMRKQMDSFMDDYWGLNNDFSSNDAAPRLESAAPSKDNNKQLSIPPNDLRGFNALWRPTVDLRENEKSFVIHAELPGLHKEDINIDVHDGVLSLSGERRWEQKEDKEKYHRVERSYGKFQRSFTLPKNVDPSNITANFENGVLELTIAKPAQAAEPPRKRIEIK